MQTALTTNPVSLIEQGAPRLIHNDAELARYTDTLFSLTAKDSPTEAELETIDLLTLLIESYESRYRLPQAGGLAVLRYLMESHGLKQVDMTSEMGSIANVSLIMAGKRNLTIRHAQALGARFRVHPSVFLDLD